MKYFSLLSILLFCSCATIVNGKKEMFEVRTNPAGATAEIYGQKCKTPCSFELRRGTNYLVRINKEGYKSKEIPLDGKSTDGWVWGNLMIGGIIGLAVDYGSKAAYDFEPEELDLNLEKGSDQIEGPKPASVH